MLLVYYAVCDHVKKSGLWLPYVNTNIFRGIIENFEQFCYMLKLRIRKRCLLGGICVFPSDGINRVWFVKERIDTLILVVASHTIVSTLRFVYLWIHIKCYGIIK